MTFAFKLSRRLAQNYCAVTAAVALVSCATERSVTDPAPPDAPTDSTPAPQPPPSNRVGYYAAPNGSSAGDGSIDRPWDLVTALAGGVGQVHPGDTIWLRGGTYRGSFRSTLQGSSGAPTVVRQYPGERAIIDGVGTPGNAQSVLRVGGQWSVFWGFEIVNTDPNRVTSLTKDGRANVIANYASHTKYINLVIHDGGVGFYNESDYFDVEITGSIWYNNGYQGPDRGHGHAIYLRSNTGPVIARDNIMFNQFGYGVHVFTNPGEGGLNNIRLEGNVAFNNGTLSSNSTSSNILMGGDEPATGAVLRDNMTYSSSGVANRNVRVGYGTLRNGTVQLLNNYIVGGATALDMGYWSSVGATDNRLMGTASILQLNDPSLSPSTFTGQILSPPPTTTKVFVRKNPYEAGRANIVVYNWARQGSVSIDLAGIVPVGARYEIRNVQDLYGTPIVSGTFGGGVVTLPMSAVPPPPPIGWSSRAPPTGIDFNAYIVTIRS